MPELCEVCKGKGQKVLAAVICTDCRQFYCSACRDVHRMFRSTKDHKYVELVAELFDEKPKADDKPKPLPAVNRQTENDAIHGKNSSGFFDVSTPTDSSVYQVEGSEFEVIWRTSFLTEFQCKTNYEKQKCELCGAAFMSDGRILAMDKANNCLILFNKRNDIQSVCLIGDDLKPSSIAVRPDDSLYVMSGRFLVTFKVVDTDTGTYITEKDSRRLPSEGRLVSLNGTKVCILNNYKVTLYEKRFQRSRPVDISIHIRGHSVVQCFLENKLGNKFLFPDHNQRKLLCISWKKELMWERKFKHPVKWIVEVENKFLVLLSNGEIFQLNTLGKLIGKIGESELEDVGWMSYHVASSRLLIAGHDGKIQIVKLDRDTYSNLFDTRG